MPRPQAISSPLSSLRLRFPDKPFTEYSYTPHTHMDAQTRINVNSHVINLQDIRRIVAPISVSFRDHREIYDSLDRVMALVFKRVHLISQKSSLLKCTIFMVELGNRPSKWWHAILKLFAYQILALGRRYSVHWIHLLNGDHPNRTLCLCYCLYLGDC